MPSRVDLAVGPVAPPKDLPTTAGILSGCLSLVALDSLLGSIPASQNHLPEKHKPVILIFLGPGLL